MGGISGGRMRTSTQRSRRFQIGLRGVLPIVAALASEPWGFLYGYAPARGGFMATTKSAPKFDERYFDLVRQFPLRPLRSERDHRRAVEVIDSLVDQEELTPAEDDYLNILGSIVKTYEDEHYPLPSVPNADLVRHLMEARDVTQAEVSAGSGIAESTLSLILSGKRGLTLAHITGLSKFFKVSPAVFISD